MNRDSPILTRKYSFNLREYSITVSYSDIAANREHAVQQMNFVHKTLDEFERDFVNRMNTLGDNLKHQINEEGAFVRA